MSGPADQAPRSEEEVVSGLLPVVLGGRKKGLRVLTMRESRRWKLELVDVLGNGIGGLDLGGVSDLGPAMDAAIDRITELVVRYDVDGSLGGKEWLETNASDQEVYAVFRRCLEVSFPFVKDLRSALAEIRALGLADLLTSGRAPAETPAGPSPSASSTSGASPDGDSASTAPLLTSN